MPNQNLVDGFVSSPVKTLAMNQTLTITTIQTDLHWEDKTLNLKMLADKIGSIKEKTELVVVPEMFSTGFSMYPEKLAETMDGETVQWMKKIAAETKVILTGRIIIKEEGRTETKELGQ